MIFKFGIYDTKLALIFTYPTFLIPFCTWLLMGYFRSIPYELEECALVDGASRWQILMRIMLPLAVPGLISAGIFAFTLSWNEFIYALTFIQSSENKTVPVGVLTELVRGDVYEWGALMAGALARIAAGCSALLVLCRLLRVVNDRCGEGIKRTRTAPLAHFPQCNASGFNSRASSRRPARVSRWSGSSGWRTASLRMTPPSIITVFAARRPHCRFS